MIARIWRTLIDPERAEEYETFAREISLPMFMRHEGFAGVLMLRAGDACQVITLWRDAAAIEGLEGSSDYRSVVDLMEGRGFRTGPAATEALDAHLFWTAPQPA